MQCLFEINWDICTICTLPNNLKYKMFPASTQCKFWLFNNEEELSKIRETTNVKYIQKYGSHINVSCFYFYYLNVEKYNKLRN